MGRDMVHLVGYEDEGTEEFNLGFVLVAGVSCWVEFRGNALELLAVDSRRFTRLISWSFF